MNAVIVKNDVGKFYLEKYYFLRWLLSGLVFNIIFYLPIEMDEDECERRRAECINGMTELENQFSFLKER